MTQILLRNAAPRVFALFMILLACIAGPVLAQTYPTKAITMIVPFPAGGATDVQARALAQAAGRELKQQIVIVNQPGVSGTLGPATMARQAAPDGYTIAIAPGTLWRQPHLQKVNYDALADFTYIAGITSYTHGVVVRQDAAWKDLQSLLAHAKANPGKVSYGTVGKGSTSHIAMERLARAAGVEFNFIPFKGAAEVYTALLGGHIDVSAEAGFAATVDGGKGRLLATFTDARLKNRPVVPTIKELGYDIVMSGSYGIAGPKGMDPKVVTVLQDAFKKAVDGPEFEHQLALQDQPKAYMDSKSYTAYAYKSFTDEKRFLGELKIRFDE
jgi:tripartite-type tricarboxylate transporter receptor subunit TctC